MNLRHLLLTIFFVFLSFLFGYAQTNSSWQKFYEDEKVAIQYQLAECTDKANDMERTYYLIKLENKTSRKLNVQYVLGESSKEERKQPTDDQEDFVSIILKPKEVRLGECPNPDHQLSLFVMDRKWSEKPVIDSFTLTKIRTYEL